MTDVVGVSDAVFSYLSRSLIALVVAPLTSEPAPRPTLHGLVRVGEQRARVVVNRENATTPGVAISFDLVEGESRLDVPYALGVVRAAAARLERLIAAAGERDGYGNVVVRSTDVDELPARSGGDLGLFSLFGMLVHGGGFPWFEDVFTFAGFLLMPGDACRLYLKKTGDRKVIGVDVSLRDSAGHRHATFTALPQELVPLIREGALFRQGPAGPGDDYCEASYDLSNW